MGKMSAMRCGLPRFALSDVKLSWSSFDRAWDACRQYVFSVTFLALVLAKCFHIFVSFPSTLGLSLLWSPTFFWTDFLLILGTYVLTRWFQWRIVRGLAALSTVPLSLYFSALTSANVSYYFHRDEEIYWDKVKKFWGEKPSARTVMTALIVALSIDAMILIAAYFATRFISRAADAFVASWTSLLPEKLRCSQRQQAKPDTEMYEQIAVDDLDEGRPSEPMPMLDTPQEPRTKVPSLVTRIVVIACSTLATVLVILRPSEPAYGYLSESLPLAMLAGPAHRAAYESSILLPGDFSWLRGTAMDSFPIDFDWLPSGDAPGAFPDWSPFHVNRDKSHHQNHLHEHYNPKKDPLHTPNLQNDVLKPIRDAIHGGSVKIKHVVLVKLESTRHDVWPLRADSYIMKRLNDSYDGGQPPKEVLDRLANLTPVAERLTGLETGFAKERVKPYGGIGASNAHTAGTYTLKSITGTVCGVVPMVIDGNQEFTHDIYQPCLPHIFEAMNHQRNVSSRATDWHSWPWHSAWMQSNFGTYDNQDSLTPILGYTDITTWESLEENNKYIPEETQEEWDHGHADVVMRNYIRDMFADAKKNNTRLFLSYLTHNTHNPWFIPGEYESFFGNSDGDNDDVNRYLNTIAFENGWISQMLEVIKEAGVADETLIVMTGDHGLSLPNDGGWTANGDPHVTNSHVPLYLAHPKLPSVQVHDEVLSTQILPTILDLLIETSSADDQGMKILKDLLPLYEGQSMIRPLINEHKGRSEWQFTTMNPGGTWVALRAAGKPYRLIAPVQSDAMWRFTDLSVDPQEWSPVLEADIGALNASVTREYGEKAAAWLTEAVHVSQWWALDSQRRWGYKL